MEEFVGALRAQTAQLKDCARFQDCMPRLFEILALKFLRRGESLRESIDFIYSAIAEPLVQNCPVYLPRCRSVTDLRNVLDVLNELMNRVPRTVVYHVQGLTAVLEAPLQKLDPAFSMKSKLLDLHTEVKAKCQRFIDQKDEEDEAMQHEVNEDYKNLDLIPSLQELKGDAPQLSANRVQGNAFDSEDHLLETHIRLMREDLLRLFREGVSTYLRGHHQPGKGSVAIYHRVGFTSVFCDSKSGSLLVRVNFESPYRNLNWEISKKLIFGSLVCLTDDNFESEPIWATVANRDVKFMQRFARPSIELTIIKGNIPVHSLGASPRYVMVESSDAYFLPYQHVIEAMKSLANMRPFDVDEFPNAAPRTRIPFVEHLVHLEQKIDAPDDLKQNPVWKMKGIFPELPPGRARFNILQDWPQDLASYTTMDAAQLAALKQILTKRLALVQGPPGTGKTFLALKALHAILDNRPPNSGPIFLVALTNHALDQLMEGVVKFEKNIIRVGGRSSSEELRAYNLHEVRYKRRVRGSVYYQLRDALRDVERRVQFTLYDLQGVSELVLQKYDLVTPEQLQSLHTGPGAPANLVDEEEEEKKEEKEEKDGFQEVKGKRKQKKEKKKLSVFEYWINQDSIDAQRRQKRLEREARLAAQLQALRGRQDPVAAMANQFALLELDEDEKAPGNARPAQLQGQQPQQPQPLPPVQMQFEMKTEEEERKEEEEEDEELREQVQEEIRLMNEERLFDPHATQAMRILPEASVLVEPPNYNEPSEDIKSCANLWLLTILQRRNLHWYWVRSIRDRAREVLMGQITEFQRVNAEMAQFNRLADRDILRKAKVVAMTTTGAARCQTLMHEVRPDIIMVEEAAEVLESHILASLHPYVKQLILIGDHKQLQPSTSHHDLTVQYRLNISLFERLMDGGLEFKILKTQRRMRPEIAALSAMHYHNLIDNAASVLDYPRVLGTAENVYLINHNHLEQHEEDTGSRSNRFEAQFIVCLAKYLVNQGYRSSDITILTTYLGQQRAINRFRNQLFGSDPRFKDLVVRVVDKYQGEENKLVLVSMVRSNGRQNLHAPMDKKNPMGFLRTANRMCVLLSRAKHGMFVIGNFDMLRRYSEVWETICQAAGHRISPQLELRCKNHGKAAFVAAADDFDQAPEGGCTKPCQIRLPLCGHVCRRLCHNDDEEHKKAVCPEPCARKHECGHGCLKKCHQDCGRCLQKVQKFLPCGHSHQVPCSVPAAEFKCPTPIHGQFARCHHADNHQCHQRGTPRLCFQTVQVQLSCPQRHVLSMPCCEAPLGVDDQPPECQKPCSQVLPCGHRCIGSCSGCAKKGSHEECKNVCTRLWSCGHQCDSKHPCTESCSPCSKKCLHHCPHSKCGHPCGKPCAPCVLPCKWKCKHHRCLKRCSEPCERPACSEPCDQTLKCGHPCIGVCGEKCPKFCRVCQPRTRVMDSAFMGSALRSCDPDDRFIELDCGHLFEVTALDGYFQNLMSSGASITRPKCPTCHKVLQVSARYGNAIKSCISSLEEIKRRLKEVEAQKARLAAEQERKGIVSAIGLGAGHWFRCPNGHLYCIGDCGGAMETAKCPECNSTIGGGSHTLAPGNTFAGDFDGAARPSWPGMDRNFGSRNAFSLRSDTPIPETKVPMWPRATEYKFTVAAPLPKPANPSSSPSPSMPSVSEASGPQQPQSAPAQKSKARKAPQYQPKVAPSNLPASAGAGESKEAKRVLPRQAQAGPETRQQIISEQDREYEEALRQDLAKFKREEDALRQAAAPSAPSAPSAPVSVEEKKGAPAKPLGLLPPEPSADDPASVQVSITMPDITLKRGSSSERIQLRFCMISFGPIFLLLKEAWSFS